jgi:hypothetical protein
MDMNVSSALTAYAYQSTLTQTGSRSQALSQALAAGQSQVASATNLLDGAGSTDALAALAGNSGAPALTALSYATAAQSGTGADAVQALLASLNGGVSALLPAADSMPTSAPLLSPSTTEALVRYAYDQSQNPANTTAQIAASGQQALLSSGLSLLG